MIPTDVKAVEVVHDDLAVLERMYFGISDPRKMMRVGAKQYSHPDRATVQELSCNAWDAHVEAGVDRPIEVTLPSVFSPHLVVKDYGYGMSLDIFREVYTQFGYSTKEHTDDQTGSLGLGSKAPLAYTETFKVVSINNGMRTEAIVQRLEDWSIVLDVVAYGATTEPSGTEITVEIHNIDEFNQKANDLFKFWLPGRVLVNGVEPEHNVGREISEGLYESTGYNSYVVMGNVAYRIINSDALFYTSKINALNFVAYVEMGADGVDFTPSREDLEYTERTKARLRRVISDFETKILTKAKSEIDAATTHAEAYKTWTKWTNLLGSSLFADLTFKGDKFVNTFPVVAYKYSIEGGRGSSYTISDYQVSYSARALFVTGAPSLSITSSQKTKVRDWLAFKGMEASNVLFMLDDSLKNPWLDPERFVSWETIKAETPKKPRTGGVGSSGRIAGSWDYYTINGCEYGKPLPATGEVYYSRLRRSKGKNVSHKMRLLGMKNDAAVIIVPDNRLAKFNRENPRVKEFFDHAASFVVKDGVSLLSDEAKIALDTSYSEQRWLDTLPYSKIDDPEWELEFKAVRNKTALTKKYNDNIELARSLGVISLVTTYVSSNRQPMLDKYPLLPYIGRYGPPGDTDALNETIFYINTRYALLEGK